jgi:hypothetical protein
MKRILLQLVVMLLVFGEVNAQGIAINTTGSAANSHAILDVSSTGKGVMIPRVTSLQRKAMTVSSGDVGMLVFDKDRNRLYMYDGYNWIPFAIEVASDITHVNSINNPPVSKNANFGYTVAVDGDYAIIGSPWDSVGTKQLVGTVQVFKKQNGKWAQVQEIMASDGKAGDLFGYSVAIKDSYLVVGAPDHDHTGLTNNGAAYIFHLSNNTWTQVMKLTDNASNSSEEFGNAVTMNNDIIGVAAHQANVGNNAFQGAVFVYNLVNNAWQFDTKLFDNNGLAGDEFGSSISIRSDGDYMVIGAQSVDIPAQNMDAAGAIYVFANNRISWYQHARLYEENPGFVRLFGTDVSISGNTIIGSDQNGHCELFIKSAFGWLRTQKFDHPVLASNAFGRKLFLYNDYLFIGCNSESVNGMNGAGSVFVYKKNAAGVFTIYKRLTDDEPFYSNGFGISLMTDGITLMIGSAAPEPGKVSFTYLSE